MARSAALGPFQPYFATLEPSAPPPSKAAGGAGHSKTSGAGGR